MGRRNRECYLCGEKYSYCPTCSQDRTKPIWMAEFHEENCVKIFEICTRFNMKSMSKIDAQNALKACDLSNKANFKPYVQRDLDIIFAEEKKPRKIKKVEPIIEVAPVAEGATTEPIAETVIEQPVVEVALEPIEAVVEESTVHEVILKEEE